MSRSFFIFLSVMSCLALQAQDYRIDFKISGLNRAPDSILVENKTQDTELLLMRDDVLHLVQDLTTNKIYGDDGPGLMLYPNPMNGMARLSFFNSSSGRVRIEAFDLTGKSVISESGMLPQGSSVCTISGLPSGFYVLNATTTVDVHSIVLISKNSLPGLPKIELDYLASANGIESGPFSQKGTDETTKGDTVRMQYNEGEQLIFTSYLKDKESAQELISTEDETLVFDFSSYAPAADFAVDTTLILVDSVLSFTDLSSGEPAGWRWDFGDGTPLVYERNPTHVYKDTGSYTVSLTALSAFGSSTITREHYIEVLGEEAVIEPLHTPWGLIGADERIEQFRKGDMTLQFMLPDSSLLSESVPVNISLDQHEFKFGISMTQGWSIYDKPNYDKYRAHLGEVFNYATLGFYWGWIERNQGQVIVNDHTLSNLEWAKARGWTVKGHPLMWHNTLPSWLKGMTDMDAVDQIIRDRIEHLLMEYPEVDHWDVYNEAIAAFKSHVEESAVTRWVSHMGGVKPAVGSLFQLCEETSPDPVYINNHYTHTDPAFKDLNQYLINSGSDLGAIGIQTHMHDRESFIDEEALWDLMEDYAQFDKPIYFTEFTMPSSVPFNNWQDRGVHTDAYQKDRSLYRPSTPEWEEHQADYMSDFYTLAFSHPATEGIVIWTASDLDEWRGTAGGILDRNHDPKPAYYALKNLIKEKWTTRIQDKSTEEGSFSFRGYYGDYKGSLTMDGVIYDFDFTLSRDSLAPITVKLDSAGVQPNIILIMADDLSPRWFSIYGEQDDVSTPNIDRLATEGVCFNTAWATPMCSPTRALLMSGQYGMRTGWLHNELTIPDNSGNVDFMRRGVYPFAKVLKDAGYYTTFCSRWGIPASWDLASQDYNEHYINASTERFLPEGVRIKEKRLLTEADDLVAENQHEVVVSLDPGLYEGGGEAVFRLESETGYGNGAFYSRYWNPAIVQNDKLIPTEAEDFAIDLYMDYIIDFMDRTRSRPGLVYLPLHIPHSSAVNVRSGVSRLPTTPASGRPGTNYAGSMKEATAYIDSAMGNLMAGLLEKDLLDNTIIIFTGDNGDSGDPTAVNPGKVRATDNGARVPFLVWGPGLIKQRGLTDELCEFSDIFPTLVDYAGAGLPGGQINDGKSLKPFLSGESDSHRDWIFSYIGSARMLRDKRYLIEAADPEFGTARGRFYDCGTNRSGFAYREITDPEGEDKLAAERLYGILNSLPIVDFSKEPEKSLLEEYRTTGKYVHKLVN